MDKKTHLVKWSTVCANKRNVGLGVLDLSILNRALLCKWIWCFANEKNALWRNVICWKFGQDQGGWVSCALRGASRISIWKEIRKEGDTVFPHVFSLGNGGRLRFWKDVWCGEEALCDSFPSLYALAANKEALVVDLWDSSREEGGWIPHFIRSFNDWELDEILCLLNTIQGKQIIESQEDLMFCKETKDGNFSVKLLFKALDRSENVVFLHKFIWNSWVPTKVGFFVWEASWSKVLTLDHLKKKGRAFANRCFLCGNEKETVDNLLIHCPQTRVIYKLLLDIVGVKWVFSLSVRETLLSWEGSSVGKKRKKAWMAAPLNIFWSIWRERNYIAFENKDFSAQRMKASFIYNLWSWSNMYIVERSRSLVDFLLG